MYALLTSICIIAGEALLREGLNLKLGCLKAERPGSQNGRAASIIADEAFRESLHPKLPHGSKDNGESKRTCNSSCVWEVYALLASA